MDPAVDPSLEEQKKLIIPFMQRAQEIQNADPKVAYYCRLYAVDQALKFPHRAKEINGLVMATLSALEKEKARLDLDRESDKVHCEAFALRIFGNADRVDRMGKADANTSKAFYAASIFFDVLYQFQDLDEDIANKQKYAAWRASEIRKALREGRPPLPPSAEEAAEAAEAERELAALDAAMTAPAPPSEGLSGLSIAGANVAPAFLPGAPSQSSSAAAPHLPATGVQRFWQGSTVAFCEAPGSPVETGTVGCILPDDRYMVALKDRLVQADNTQLAPVVQPGAQVHYLPQGRAQTVPAEVVLANDGMGWPPSFLVRLPDGIEQAADAQQLALPPPAHVTQQQHAASSVEQAMSPSYSSDSLPPPPPLPSDGQAYQGGPSQIPSIMYPSMTAPPPPMQSSASAAQLPPHPPTLFGGPAAQPPPVLPTVQPPVPPPSLVSHPQFPPPPPPPPVAAATPTPIAAPAATSSNAKPSSAKGLPIQVITDAQKKAKYAVSALNFEDVSSAVQYLSEALQLLTTQRH